MPRRGKGVQPVADFPSPGYGQGEELAQMQSDVPLPQARDLSPQFPTGPPAQGDPIAQAQQYVNPSISPTAPTQQPNVPITNGLPRGPGAGPEALNMPRRRNYAVDALELVASITGDLGLLERARRNRQ